VTHALEELNGVMGRQLHGMAAMVGGLPRQNLWLDGLLGGSEDSIVGIMRSWSALADRGDRLCRLALRMALAAKDAVLRGDVAAVERFVREWLGFKRVTEPLVDAASSVLIDEHAWLPHGLSAMDYDLRPRLRKLTIDQHRNFRSITETRLCGQRVLSLNKAVPLSADSTTTLAELVAAKPATASENDISDPRLLRIFAKLSGREQEIVRAQALEERTWPDAAVSCGGTPAEGANLARKVRRLSKSAGTPGTAPCRSSGAERRTASAGSMMAAR
jgi:hypothetical protein